MMGDVSLRIRRPNDYNPVVAAHLGPTVPIATLNLAAIGLNPNAPPMDGPDRIFIGGLPYYMEEAQARERTTAPRPPPSLAASCCGLAHRLLPYVSLLHLL